MILVIGASGNNGAAVARQLLASGQPFKALVRKASDRERLPSQHIDIVIGDVDDGESLAKAMVGIERVFISTAYSPKMPAQVERIAQAAKAAAVEHIVLLSGVGAALDAGNRTMRWLGRMERAVVDSGIDYTFLRSASFMQNFYAHAATIRDHGAIYAPMGGVKYTHVDTRDTGDVAAIALTTDVHRGKTYTITGSEQLSFAEIAEIFSEELGRKITYVDEPMAEAENRLRQFGLPGEMVETVTELWADVKTKSPFALSSAVQRITGRPPRTFAAFVRDHGAVFSPQTGVKQSA